MKPIIMALVISTSLCFTVRSQETFWYANDVKVPLFIDSSRVNVRMTPGTSPDQAVQVLSPVDNLASVLIGEQEAADIFPCEIKDRNRYDLAVSSLYKVTSVVQVEPFYRSQKGNSRITTGGIFVRFRSGVSRHEIDSINTALNTYVAAIIPGIDDAYRLERKRSCKLGDIDLANAYHGMRETVFAHPDFAIPIVLNSYKLFDYYHPYQWHIKKITGDFNSASVWDFAGLTAPIVVAVVDDGVAPHEDLPEERIILGWDFADNRAGGTPFRRFYHGQGCAGIIAASHCTDSTLAGWDATGVISMAPNVRIMPLKIVRNDGQAGPVSKYASAIGYAWQNGADVISNSWGFKPEYWDDPEPPGLSTAFMSAAYQGRNGLGCPIIFAAGNEGETHDTVPYPPNYFTNFVVGAIRQNDSLWSYSSYDHNDHMVDLVAPSGGGGNEADVWTLDQMDTLGANRADPAKDSHRADDSIIFDCPPGANDLDYNCKFSGTSASCPMVAGVAALLLSRDPTLPRTRLLAGGGGIYEILRGSAVTHLDWGTINPPDYAYGYGRVDAYRAVLSIARGDVNNNGIVSIGDISLLIDHVMGSGAPIVPDSLLGDVTCEGQLTVADISLLIDHLFISLRPLPLPCFNFND